MLVEIDESARRASIFLHQLAGKSEPVELSVTPCAPLFVKLNEADLFLLIIPEASRTIIRAFSIGADSTEMLYSCPLNL